MRKLLLIASAIALAACSEQYREVEDMRRHCDKSTAQQRAEFILQCSNGDAVDVCTRAAERVYCPEVVHSVTQRCGLIKPCMWYDVSFKVKE